MRIIDVSGIRTGMRLAKDIYLCNGSMLLAEGMPLKESYIDKLTALGVYTIYIHDDISQGIEISDVIHEETRLHARALVKTTMDHIARNRSLGFDAISNTMNNIIDELIYNRNIVINLEDIRTVDTYTFSHSVNVAVLAIVTGIKLGYDFRRLKELGMGALLHDIGKMKVPPEILNKPGVLTQEEFEEVKRHTIYGHESLKAYPEIGYRARFIVLAHHERYDGLGYPIGIKGKRIHEFTRIVSVADVYDALTSDRVYRRRINRDQALEYILSMCNKHFDKEIVEAFIESIPMYPLGAIVRLNTNEKGIVVKVEKSCPKKPVVRVITDPYGIRYDDHREIDLMNTGDIEIVEICSGI